MSKLRVLDLFSGIGGFSLGLERTGGFETKAFCEIDEHCQKVLRKHWPQTEVYRDVSKLQGTPGSYEIITGGFPCQNISFAGNKEGIRGEKSGLWTEYFRLIEEIRPRYAIIENVEYLRKNGLGVVLNDLARIGYVCEWSCIPARSVGYPHQRKRLFLISYPSSERFDEYFREKRHIQADEEWESAKIHSNGTQCEFESFEIRPILSRRTFENIRNNYSDEGAYVSSVRRVIDGVSEGLDENRRKQRIKQLGNSIVPRIAEIVGEAILRRENIICNKGVRK